MKARPLYFLERNSAPTEYEAAGSRARLGVLENGKNFLLPLPEFEPQTVHPVALSLYRLRLCSSKNRKPRVRDFVECCATIEHNFAYA